jgi:hypothetical protein
MIALTPLSWSGIVRSLCVLTLLFLFVGADGKRQAVVAEIGNERITLEEFWIGYLDVLKNPKMFDSPEARAGFLDELIMARVLAREGEVRGKGNDELFKYKVNGYRDKCLRDQHFEAVIKPGIHVEEKDVEEAYQFTQEQRKLSHLFFKTRHEADSAFALLQLGADFDTLARTTFQDSVLSTSGGNLGWVEWDQLDYDLGTAAFRLRQPFVSRPVKSPFGYHILKVTDSRKNPLITRQQYVLHRRKVRYLLEWKLGDKYSLDYVRDMLSHASVQVFPEVMDFVRKKVANQFVRKPSISDQMTEIHLRESEIRVLERSLWDARNEVLALVNGKKYTVGEFMTAIVYVPYASVYSGFKAAFDCALRDFLLTEEAISMGLERAERVEMRTRLYREYLLQLAYRRELVRNVKVTEDNLRAYFERHKAELKNATFEQIHDFLQDIVLTKKKQEVVPARYSELTAGLIIRKHIKVVNDYYDALLRYEEPR